MNLRFVTVPTTKFMSTASRGFISSIAARLVVLPITGLATLLTSRFVSSEFGLNEYAIYSLIASLPLLLPMSDLGLSAAATNAASALPSSPTRFVETMRRSARALWIVSGALLAIDAAIFLTIGWPNLFGLEPSEIVNGGAALAFAFFALSVPGSLGAATLIGLRLNRNLVLFQGLAPVLAGLFVFVFAALTHELLLALALSLIGLFLGNWSTSIYARSRKEVRRARQEAREAASISSPPLWDVALPMVLITLGLPLAFQTGRVVLGWQSTLAQLAIYAAALIAFLPVFSLIQVAGRSLWGVFAQARESNLSGRKDFVSGLLTSAVVGLVGAAGLTVFGPIVASLATSGAIHIPISVFAWLSAVILVQAIHLPSGMYLTDARGLRFQAVTTILMGVGVLASSILLTPTLGAIGPPASLAIGMALFQALPCLLLAIKTIRARDYNQVISGVRT